MWGGISSNWAPRASNSSSAIVNDLQSNRWVTINSSFFISCWQTLEWFVYFACKQNTVLMFLCLRFAETKPSPLVLIHAKKPFLLFQLSGALDRVVTPFLSLRTDLTDWEKRKTPGKERERKKATTSFLSFFLLLVSLSRSRSWIFSFAFVQSWLGKCKTLRSFFRDSFFKEDFNFYWRAKKYKEKKPARKYWWQEGLQTTRKGKESGRECEKPTKILLDCMIVFPRLPLSLPLSLSHS